MLGLPTCKQVTEQASELLDEDLPILKRLRLKMHLLICASCRRYLLQMKLTSKTVGYWMKGRPMPLKLREELLREFENGTHCDKHHHK